MPKIDDLAWTGMGDLFFRSFTAFVLLWFKLFTIVYHEEHEEHEEK